jgi:hypothetical protein
MFLLGRETLSNPILVMTESESGGIWAIPVKRKGNYSSYVSQRIANIIQRIGYARCIIKCDQEPAIIDVTKEVKISLFQELQEYAKNVSVEGVEIEFAELKEPVITTEHSPVGESQANGRIENAVGRVQGQIGALHLDLEEHLKIKLEHNHPIWPWLIEYAAQTLHQQQYLAH